MKKLVIVTVDFNSEKETHECIKSLSNLNLSQLTLEIVVVDNASKTPLVLKLNEKKDIIHLIRNDKNLGFTGGFNTGIRIAIDLGADYIMLLNNDTIADHNLVKELLAVADSDSLVGLVAPKIYFARGHEFHAGRYTQEELGRVIWYAGGGIDWNNVLSYHRGVDDVDKGQFDKDEQIDFVSGCCMFLKREVIKNIGMLDDKYFLYFEDADFSVRIKKAGFKIMYAYKAKLWHVNAASGGGSGSVLQDYYITRNRMIFGMKYAPFRSKIALLRESFKLLFLGRKWQRLGILDYYKHKFGKGSFEI